MREQIFIFLVCILSGVVGGGLYDLFTAVPIRLRWLRILRDIFFCLVYAAAFLTLSVHLEFPNLRFYMFLGFLCGFFLYWKSLHKIVAFFKKKVYNRMRRIRKDGRICRKRNGLRRKIGQSESQ
ncbi:MAG: spore cortex biosynthesis protein YabQ [Clostridia bacterium]|nr:spore cortex biosynthesis protein YabQ [Clostridia bacterium]